MDQSLALPGSTTVRESAKRNRSMTKSKIAIIGLGLIGNSIGLGLAKESRDFEIVGHDKDSAAASQSKKLKAVDRTEWNLISACSNADLVILALPAAAIRDTFQAVAGELKPGAIVLDTASIKAPVQAWASELLPDTVLFIGTLDGAAGDDSSVGGEILHVGHCAHVDCRAAFGESFADRFRYARGGTGSAGIGNENTVGHCGFSCSVVDGNESYIEVKRAPNWLGWIELRIHRTRQQTLIGL